MNPIVFEAALAMSSEKLEMTLQGQKLAEDINARRRLNVTNALTTAGVLGGAAWGLSRRGRFDASWMNPAWKNARFGVKQRLAQGLMGAGTGAAVALPAQVLKQPLLEKRALLGWGK